jgi:predicted nucleic acid-binding protein
MVILGRLVIHDLNPDEIRRSSELMDRYSDRPMDLADATLVALAETIGARAIFSLDSDFRVYRLANGQALNVVP